MLVIFSKDGPTTRPYQSETRKRENTSTWFEGRNAKIFQFTDHK